MTASALSRPAPDRAKILFAAVLAAMVSAAPMLIPASLFMLPVSQEFGWSRSVFPMALMASACAGGLASPIAGWLVDRLGARPVMLAGLLALGLSHLALAISDGSLGWTFAAFITLGAASSFSGAIGITRVISVAFSEGRARALASSLGVGAGIGGAITPILSQAAIANYGWRVGYLALGAYAWILAIPAVWLLFPRGRTDMPQESGSEPSDGLTLRETLRVREFWLLVVLVAFNAVGVGGILGHWSPLLVDRGLTVTAAAGLLSAVGLVKVVGQLGGGWLLDRVQTPRMAPLIIAPVALGVATFAFGTGWAPLAAGSFLFGLGEGAELGLLSYLVSRYFGLRRFGEVLGWLVAISIFINGSSNVLMGALFDMTSSYQKGLYLLTSSLAIALLAAACLGPYRYGVQARTAASTG